MLKTDVGSSLFGMVNDLVNGLLAFTTEGSRFLFGNLVTNNVPVGSPLGDPSMGPIIEPNQTGWAGVGAYFAFGVLPTLIFFSSITAVGYHLGFLQRVVGAVNGDVQVLTAVGVALHVQHLADGATDDHRRQEEERKSHG